MAPRSPHPPSRNLRPKSLYSPRFCETAFRRVHAAASLKLQMTELMRERGAAFRRVHAAASLKRGVL